MRVVTPAAPIAAALLLGALVSMACGNEGEPRETSQPSLVVSPSNGGAGTEVGVSGTGFPGRSHVYFHLGWDDTATGKWYGEADVEPNGHVSASFTMPAEWPDGRPITENQILVIATTRDFASTATAKFAYAPSTPVPRVTITGTVRDVSPSAQIIELAEPVEGFQVIALTEETLLTTASDTGATLLDVQPGMRVQAWGKPGTSQALLAYKVVILGP